MKIKFFFIILLASTLFVRVISQELSQDARARAELYRAENQYNADLGNGFYRNPVLSAPYGDLTVAQMGDTYYLPFVSGISILTYRSKDLVNWEPVGRHLFGQNIGTIWAPDLVVFDDQLHLYMPIQPPGSEYTEWTIMVSSTNDPEKGWSEPVDLETLRPWGIDPGVLVTPNGDKFLFIEDGIAAPLAKDGLSLSAPLRKVYDGWPIPEDWTVECFCLEGPKLSIKDDYYYMFSTQGGTAGPTTSHMGVIAKAKDPMGPWENSPYNPLVHTYSHDEPWWQQGHGEFVQGPAGDWWVLFTARPNGFLELGKQTLLLPLEWTDDGWPVIKEEPQNVIAKPANGVNVGHGLPLSDNFISEDLGLQWKESSFASGKYTCGNGKLIFTPGGEIPKDAPRLEIRASNRSFEASVEVECSPGAYGGIGFLSGTQECVASDGNKAFIVSDYRRSVWRLRNSEIPFNQSGKVYLKVRNWRKDISFYCSEDGKKWRKFSVGARIDNSYQVALFAAGDGEVSFSNFRYTGLE